MITGKIHWGRKAILDKDPSDLGRTNSCNYVFEWGVVDLLATSAIYTYARSSIACRSSFVLASRVMSSAHVGATHLFSRSLMYLLYSSVLMIPPWLTPCSKVNSEVKCPCHLATVGNDRLVSLLRSTQLQGCKVTVHNIDWHIPKNPVISICLHRQFRQFFVNPPITSTIFPMTEITVMAL